MFGEHSLPVLRKGDGILVVGTYIVPEVFPQLGDVWSAGANVVHIDLNGWEIAKNHPVNLGIVADPKTTLAALGAELDRVMTAKQKGAASARLDEARRARAAKREADLGTASSLRNAVPLKMSRFVEELAAALPPGAIVFDEALTSSPPIALYLPPQRTGSYFVTRGGSLGVGFPGALGVKLANPSKTVVGFSGDGGCMYTIQALWTAARHGIDAKFVVCNNGCYHLLQLNIDEYWKEQGVPKHEYPVPFDLSRPAIRFDELARSLGVPAVRVEKPTEIAAAIRQALGHPGPFLIDLVLEGNSHPDRIGHTCRQ